MKVTHSPEMMRRSVDRVKECLALITSPVTPMTQSDIAEHNRLIGREMARAEARRQASPQLELEPAA